MTIDLITLAIPFFLLLIGIEYYIAKIRRNPLYDLSDFSNNLSCGLLEQVCTFPLQGLLILNYNYLYKNHAIYLINPNFLYSWILLWLGVDFCYYWFHRASHRNNFLWIGHAVHHQSEYYNLSVALRQGIAQTLFAWIIYLPLAWLGFPTWMFLIVSSLNTLYQFWIHTSLITNMGYFEIFFNTPSHHRVHHGKNPQYIDKNYGGSLIIWDKLFGTYEKETEAAHYGTTEPLNSWNPFYANVKIISDLYHYGQHLDSLGQRILIFFRSPEWIINILDKKKPPSVPLRTYPTNYILFNVLIAIIAYVGYRLVVFNHILLGGLLGLFIIMTLFQIGFVLNYGMKVIVKWFDLFRGFLLIILTTLS